jgi:hypothetical protein
MTPLPRPRYDDLRYHDLRYHDLKSDPNLGSTIVYVYVNVNSFP